MLTSALPACVPFVCHSVSFKSTVHVLTLALVVGGATSFFLHFSLCTCARSAQPRLPSHAAAAVACTLCTGPWHHHGIMKAMQAECNEHKALLKCRNAGTCSRWVDRSDQLRAPIACTVMVSARGLRIHCASCVWGHNAALAACAAGCRVAPPPPYDDWAAPLVYRWPMVGVATLSLGWIQQ